MSDLSLGSAGGSLGITFLPLERSSVDLERGPEGLQRCHLPVVSPPHAAAALLGAVQAASLARRSQEAKESSCYFLGFCFLS